MINPAPLARLHLRRWLALGAVGSRASRIYNRARDRARVLAREGNAPSAELQALVRSSAGLRLQVASVVIVLAFLVDMIFKPGA